MIKSLTALKKKLAESGDYVQARRVDGLIKKSSLPGVDIPADETEVEGIDNILKYLEENKGIFIYLDNPKNSKKKFGYKKVKLPFHYGEFTELLNPADEMGWDIIVVPSASEDGVRHIESGHNLEPVGYVPVNPSEKTWRSKTKSKKRPNGKPPPIGNDKIILSPNKEVLEDDLNEIEDFFSDMWQFDDIIWLEA
tara:strand:+ start:3035 stop:3619 length:585 start_codon:yes stop_codon:yes gene_type:complete